MVRGGLVELAERQVLELLKSKPMTFDELRGEVKGVSGLILREAVARLVRRGLVVKEPDYERRRFLLRVVRVEEGRGGGG